MTVVIELHSHAAHALCFRVLDTVCARYGRAKRTTNCKCTLSLSVCTKNPMYEVCVCLYTSIRITLCYLNYYCYNNALDVNNYLALSSINLSFHRIAMFIFIPSSVRKKSFRVKYIRSRRISRAKLYSNLQFGKFIRNKNVFGGYTH